MTTKKGAAYLVAGSLVLGSVAVVPVTVSAAPAPVAVAPAVAAKATATAKTATGSYKNHYCYGKTKQVADGDTIDVKLTKGCLGWKKGKLVVVRQAGIQATEVAHPWSKAECWGNQGRAFMRKQFPKGSKVRLSAYTRTKSDTKTAKGQTRYVMYAYSWKKGKWVDSQAAIVAAGYAFNKGERVEREHNVKYLKLTQQAIAQRKGMWGNNSKCGSYTANAKLQAWTGWKTDGQDNATTANTEWFKVRNVGTVPVPLNKWRVRDGSHSFGGGKDDWYTINANVILQPGQTFTLHPGAGTNNLSTLHFYNNHPRLPFYPNAHAKAPSDATARQKTSTPYYGYTTILMDPGGNMRAPSSYPCVYACAKPSMKISDVVYKGTESALITNTGGTTIDLTGVVVQVSSGRQEFRTGQMLGPGERIMIYFNRGGDSDRSTLFFGDAGGRLPDSGGKIWLRTSGGTTIDMASWNGGGTYVF